VKFAPCENFGYTIWEEAKLLLRKLFLCKEKCTTLIHIRYTNCN